MMVLRLLCCMILSKFQVYMEYWFLWVLVVYDIQIIKFARLRVQITRTNLSKCGLFFSHTPLTFGFADLIGKMGLVGWKIAYKLHWILQN